MALVFHRRLAIPLSALAFFTVALTGPPSTSPFPMPPTMLFVLAAIGIASVVFSTVGAVPWFGPSRALARVRPCPPRDPGEVLAVVETG